MKRSLIVEDDTSFCLMLKTWFEKNGFMADVAYSAEEAKRYIKENNYDIILSDLRLPGADGISLLQWIKQTTPNSEVFIMTGYADIQTAVSAIKLGAFDYLEKPIKPDILKQKIAEALSKKNIAAPKDFDHGKEEEENPYIEGNSAVCRTLDEHLRLVAPTTMSVLITGESGTGKEYAARYLHENSKRKQSPFIALDCGAITKELGASELFGHAKGAFTSAVENKKGVFEYANGGTLFLDEIGNLSYEVQVQLLRALQERVIKPVGSNKEIKVDVRIITATNENLLQNIAEGRFREDLYHRINEFSINMPPLRARGEDLFLYIDAFLESANKELEKAVKGFSEPAKAIMSAYSWPGNLRELKNTIKRAVLLAASDYIEPQDLPLEMIRQQEPKKIEITPLKRPDERALILETLMRNNYNKSKAAKDLGIDRKTLYNKIEQYNIDL